VSGPALVPRWKRIAGCLVLPSGVGGAFLGLALFQLGEGGNRFGGIVVGWLYGVAVAGLIRCLSVPSGWYWLAGLFAGPIPFALLTPDSTPAKERGVILVGALLGLLIGLLETAHARRAGAARSALPPGPLPAADPGPAG